MWRIKFLVIATVAIVAFGCTSSTSEPIDPSAAPSPSPASSVADPSPTAESQPSDSGQEPTRTPEKLPTPTAVVLPSPTAVPLPTSTPAPTPTSTSVPPTSSPTTVPTPVPTPLPTLATGAFPEGVVSAFTTSETLERDPTPTATSFPAPSTPFEEPTAIPAALGDLQPYFGSGQPVRVRNPNGGPFTKKSDLLVDFYVTNGGSEIIEGDYFIDLYIDDEIAQRWGGISIKPNSFIYVKGGSGLLDLFDLQPGEHEVKLVIDSTNLIPEKFDGDNTYTQPFTWEVAPKPTPLPTDVLPNLSLIGDGSGIRIAPYLGAAESGGLSTLGPTTVEFAALNDSPIPIYDDFALNVWFDGMLVYFAHYTGALGGNYAYLSFEDLADVVRITPGEHTIKLVADPGNVIKESDETDNTVEITLTWGTDDPIAAPVAPTFGGAPIREVQLLPNLAGTTPYGWEAALGASNTAFEYEIGEESLVWAAADTSISFAVRNSSRTNSAADGSFSVNLLIDREIVDSMTLSSGDDAGDTWSETFTLTADSIEAGHHFVQLEIDPENDVLEFDETDNSFGRWFEFLSGDPVVAVATPVEFSDEDIRAAFAPLTSPDFIHQVRRAEGSTLDLPDWFDEIEEMGRYGYYLLTGRDLEDEPIVIHILPHDQFVAASYNACMTDYYLWTLTEYVATFDYCQDFGGEIGFKYRLDGKVNVYVDMGISPIQALGTYFHELGHALQDLENPDQTVTSIGDDETYLTLRGLFEAEAQTFEAAALRTIESYLGIELMRFPDDEVTRGWVEFLLTVTRDQAGSAEHVLGHTLVWYEVLGDTSGLNLDDELRENGVLSATSTKALYDYLVSLTQDEVVAWRNKISASQAVLDEYVEIALGRLEVDLPSTSHGNPDLIEPAFLIP